MRIANFRLGRILSLRDDADRVRSCRYGEVVLRDGEFVAIYPRWWPRVASQWDVMRDDYLRSLDRDECRFYYSFPIRTPGFMSLNYAHSGPKTQYKTLRRGVLIADEIAAIRQANAIVCQAFNQRVTEALMNRWGYVRHASRLGSNHYIKRFTK
jgi:hypothetical protein